MSEVSIYPGLNDSGNMVGSISRAGIIVKSRNRRE